MVLLYFQELLNQVQGRKRKDSLSYHEYFQRVIAFINLKICETLKQNWYKSEAHQDVKYRKGRTQMCLPFFVL